MRTIDYSTRANSTCGERGGYLHTSSGSGKTLRPAINLIAPTFFPRERMALYLKRRTERSNLTPFLYLWPILRTGVHTIAIDERLVALHGSFQTEHGSEG